VNHFQCFWGIFTNFYTKLISALCSSIITAAAAAAVVVIGGGGGGTAAPSGPGPPHLRGF
jgi:hypothetical protein